MGPPVESSRLPDGSDVRGLGTLGPLNDLELHLLALGEGPVSLAADGREVDEDVIAPSRAMKPNPFSFENHLTVPVSTDNERPP